MDIVKMSEPDRSIAGSGMVGDWATRQGEWWRVWRE